MRNAPRRTLLNCAMFIVGAAAILAAGTAIADDALPDECQTPGGVPYLVLGGKAGVPAPTLFIFSTDAKTSLTDPNYATLGRLVAARGFCCVSLDVPGHGSDLRAGEAAGIAAWRSRVEHNEAFLAAFTARASAVLEALIAERRADPARIAACGTSRGGFAALHFAAADARVACVAAFAPVTRLSALREFAGLEEDPRVEKLAAVHLGERLAKRRLWLCIGNRDERVGTDHAVEFARAVVAAHPTSDEPVDVELHITPTAGHRTHATAHEEAAAWLLARLLPEPAGPAPR